MPYIEGPLSYICNLSLNQGIIPDILKIANVIILYKKKIHWYLATTDQFPCYVVYPKFLKK